MSSLQKLKSILDTPQKLLIIPHHYPDGDTLASSLALARLCKKRGHQVTIISPTPFPKFLQWMEGAEEILIFDQIGSEKAKDIVADAQTIFLMDFVPFHRMGKLEPMVAESQAYKVAIDHHPDEGVKVDLLFCEPEAPATCSLLYNLFTRLGLATEIDATIATALYVGILTDTGGFAHSNTNAEVHRITADLMEKGAHSSVIYHAIFGNQSLTRMRFIGHVITQRLIVLKSYRTAYFAIPKQDFKKFRLQPGDKAGIVNYALNLEDIDVAALIVEEKAQKPHTQEVRCSFRSIGDISVNDLSQRYFGGGGHKNASGALLRTSLEEATDRFEAMIRKEMPAILAKDNT